MCGTRTHSNYSLIESEGHATWSDKLTTAGTAVYLQVVLRKTAVLAAHASHSGL